ncbi:MAG: mechanosensitive ion channel [Erysipelotrichaceae bacterium]|nr:mechanosensitive ion channel [Erysipelotrichaceae bacterium]
MKKATSLIIGIIALVLIVILANPKLLPLPAETVNSMLELQKEHLMIQRSTMVTGARILTAVLAMCILVVIYLIIEAILHAIGNKSSKSRTVTTMLCGLFKYLFYIIGFVWALSILGVNTTAVLAGVGIIGLILGFGAQSLIEDIITGFFIIFEGEYAIGDIIILDDFRGVVRSIGVRTTVIEDAGGNLKVVNNSDIRNFQNRSRNDSKALVTASVAYETDMKYLEKVIQQAMGPMYEAHKDLYLGVPEYLGVEDLADSGVVLKFAVPVKENNVFAAQRMFRRDLFVLFGEKNITIPFPQVVVHKAE